jgi:hypothetical protein
MTYGGAIALGLYGRGADMSILRGRGGGIVGARNASRANIVQSVMGGDRWWSTRSSAKTVELGEQAK